MDPRDFTLTDLEEEDWGPPTFDSHLVRQCHALRHKKIRDMSIEDLRILIGQEIGLEYLLPVALERLELDPLAAGDFYPGDLLVVVLRARQSLAAVQQEALEAVYRRAIDSASPSQVAYLLEAYRSGEP